MTSPPQRILSPPATTTLSPTTQSRNAPSSCRLGPLALVWTSPPTVTWSDWAGSSGRNSRLAESTAWRAASRTPASTDTFRLASSNSTIRVSRSRQTTTSRRLGGFPRPIRAPSVHGSIDAPAALHAAATEATASWEPGRTARAGFTSSTAKRAAAGPVRTYSSPTREKSFCARTPGSAGMGHLLGDREDLAGVREVLRVEGPLHLHLGLDVLLGDSEPHGVHLLDADPVLAADRPAHLDAELEDLHAGLHHPGLLLGVAPVEQDQRVEVPVPGVEDVGDLQVVLLADLGHLSEDGGEGGAGHRSVADEVARGDTGHRPERAAAPGPEGRPLGVVPGHANFAGAVLLADVGDGLGLLLEVVLQPVQFDDEHSGTVEREAALDRRLDRLDDELVHHLEGRRDHACRHDGRDGLASLLDAVVDSEERLHPLGQADDLRHDLGADAERPLAADEDPGEVVARRVGRLPAQARHLAVRQDDGHPEDVVRGDAVLEAVGSAGVLRHVAAERRGLLARGVRQVLIAQRRQGAAELEVEHPGLHPGPHVGHVHLEELVHPNHLDDDPALDGDRPAAQVRAAAPGDEGGAPLVADLDHSDNLVCRMDEGHGVRAPLL